MQNGANAFITAAEPVDAILTRQSRAWPSGPRLGPNSPPGRHRPSSVGHPGYRIRPIRRVRLSSRVVDRTRTRRQPSQRGAENGVWIPHALRKIEDDVRICDRRVLTDHELCPMVRLEGPDDRDRPLIIAGVLPASRPARVEERSCRPACTFAQSPR